MSLAILVPVLWRPHRAKPTVEGFAATVPAATVYFIPDEDDYEEIAAIEDAGGTILYQGPGGDERESYSVKMNNGVRLTEEPLIYFGADDLAPQPGWFEAALAKLEGDIQVVATNDLIDYLNSPYSPHYIVTREYALQPTIDGERGPFWEGYGHYADMEFTATAKLRGVYAFAEDAHVEHLHPVVNRAPNDAAYERWHSMIVEDVSLRAGRSSMWEGV